MNFGALLVAGALGGLACAGACKRAPAARTIRLSYTHGLDSAATPALVAKVAARLQAFGVGGAAVVAPSLGRLLVTMPESAARDLPEIEALLAKRHQVCASAVDNGSDYMLRLAARVASDASARGTVDVVP